MKHIFAKVIALFVLFGSPTFAQNDHPDHAVVLNAFFEAFNAHDPAAMAEWVRDDIEVVYLSANGEASRSDGVEAMVDSMQGYFAALPTARSQMLSFLADGDNVAVRERASWTSGDGEARSQTALAVYRIEEGLIAAVWYYPETRDDR